MTKLKMSLLALLTSLPFASKANTGLTMDTSTQVDMTYTQSSSYYVIKTTGTDPHICSTALPANMDVKDCRLEFDYQTSADVDLQLFFRDPESEARSLKVPGALKTTGKGEWKRFVLNITPQRNAFSWGNKGSKLRIDFGNRSGVTINIRNLGIKGCTRMSSDQKASFARGVERYLAADYTARVTYVEVGKDNILVRGTTASAGCKLIDSRMYGDLTLNTECFDAASNLPAGQFEVTIPRYIEVAGCKYDRLLSRWAITDAKHNLLSHGRYADKVYEIRHASPGILKTKKGIGGIGPVVAGDIDNLGLGSATLNIILNTFIGCNNAYGCTVAYVYNGKTFYINQGAIDGLDGTLKTCEKKGVVVAAILLVVPDGGEAAYSSTMRHPEYSGKAPYTMPDLGSIYSIEAYAATIDYLANRYSQSGNGRIHHWILHNEVDQNLSWTDMGAQPLLRYVDTYEKSMRLVSNIVRQYDPNAYVLASFTSSWNKAHSTDGFTAKSMLDNIVAYSNAEGDYRWGVAAHPYPQNFFKPKFWEADTEATYSENSGYSTFKNIEVISNWMLRREHYYKGEEKRILFFSENGVNSLDNSTYNLKVQAAGAAWAWKKTMQNAGVDAIMWHNWWDHPAEAAQGVRLGLVTDEHVRKPAWYVWQAAGTDKESSVFDQYLSIIGISNWGQIHHGVSTSGSENTRLELDQSSKSEMTIPYDGTYQKYTLKTTGGDPQVSTQAMSAAKSDNSNTLVFEYQSANDIPDFQVFISPLAYEERSVIVPLSASTDWKRVYINLAPLAKQYGWGGAGSKLRFDPGSVSGRTMKIRHICVNSGEKSLIANLSTISDGANQCTVKKDANTGSATIVTAAGGDPFFYSSKLAANLLPKATKIMFEYQASTSVQDAKIYFVDYAGETRSISLGNLNASTKWTQKTVDIAELCRIHGWGFEGDYMRFDPGTKSGLTFKIRNICINTGEYASTLNLQLDNYNSHDNSLSRDAECNPSESDILYGQNLAYSSWTINTTGSDPYIVSNPLDKNLNANATKLYFEYKASADITPLVAYFMYPETNTRSTTYNDKMPATSEWTPVILDISQKRKEYGWGYAGDRLRLTLGKKVGVTVNLRRLAIYDGTSNTVDVNDITTPTDFSVRGVRGGAIITSSTPRTFTIYNIAGVIVNRLDVEGETLVSLDPGVYIINGVKVVVY